MPTRNVVLTDHQAGFVEQLVATGRYQNASEVLREGLRLIEQRDAERAARLLAFRDAVEQGESDIAAGHAFAFSPALVEAMTQEARDPADKEHSTLTNGSA